VPRRDHVPVRQVDRPFPRLERRIRLGAMVGLPWFRNVSETMSTMPSGWTARRVLIQIARTIFPCCARPTRMFETALFFAPSLDAAEEMHLQGVSRQRSSV